MSDRHQEAALAHYRAAEELVRQYGYEPGELQSKWRRQPAPVFDYNECMAAVLDALNREGIPAWNGDATGCVVQIVEAQAKKAQAAHAAGAAAERARVVALIEAELRDVFGDYELSATSALHNLLDKVRAQ